MPARSTTLLPLWLALRRLTLVGLLLLSGCAAAGRHPDPPGAEDFNDPFENVNRSIFRFNQNVDRHVLVPVAKGYRAVVPPPARDALRDFFTNLRGPIILANDVLQGDLPLAGRTAARFVLNSTLGMAGFVDIAGRWGIPYHYQDFGLTFAVWGIGEGPYLVIPVLGPSNPRDLTGNVAEQFADPWDIMAGNAHYLWAPIIRHAASGIDERSRYIDTLAEIERTSLDYYATIRSLYRQRRQALIHHEQKNLPPNPSLGSGGPPPAPAPSTPPEAAPVIAELLPPEPVPAAVMPATLTPPRPAAGAPKAGRPKSAQATAKPGHGTAASGRPRSFLAVATLTPPGAPAAATLTPPDPAPSR